MKVGKINLLLRILIAILLGVLCGHWFNEGITRLFVTFNSLFSNFLSLMIPFIILGLIIPGIAKLGSGSGKMLLLTVILSYGFTIFAGCFALATCRIVYPMLIHNVNLMDIESPAELTNYFTIEIPPVLNVMSALVISFILGLGLSVIKSSILLKAADEFKEIIVLTLNKVIIPLLPLYIFGIFLVITYNGQAILILGVFFRIILLIFAITFVFLFIQFAIAGWIGRKNPINMLKVMLTAYVTALGTQSSAATIPVTLTQAKKLGVQDEVANFVIPLCATIHLSGSTIKIVSYSMAILMITGTPFDLWVFVGFILLLGITMVAAPGVPGGAIMAALGLLQLTFGFDSAAVAMMIALYMATDSFGTATNVTGDGAIAVIIDSYIKKKKKDN